jgi:putative tricarboxylic transport membrane protein
MVPLLTLGIPGSGATAVILGAFLLHGVQPGPQIFQTQSALVYAIFASRSRRCSACARLAISRSGHW